MKNIYTQTGNQLSPIESHRAGTWISLVNPSVAESQGIADEFNIDLKDITAALDVEERSRIQVEDGYVLIIVDIPTSEQRGGKEWYVTIPLGIILCGDVIITTCLEDAPLLREFAAGKVRGLNPAMKTRFTLSILFHNATLFMQYLRQIDRQTDEAQTALRRATRNEELIELLELDLSLVYFSTSLRSNERVLERFMRTPEIKKYEDDEDLLDDTIVENKQAIEMADIYTSVLSGTMDAFASVIANNQNDIMKLLALVTIIMAIPTMIFSAYGMNLAPAGMPLSDHPFGFLIVIVFSFALSLGTTLFFVRKRFF
jgi:magnesium transporter